MAGSLRFVLGLAAVGGDVSGVLARFLWENLARQGRIDQTLRRLEQSGLIVMQGAPSLDQRVLRLTETGRQMAQGGIDPPTRWGRHWDGLWRIVAFDIPEAKTALRTRLRRRLHEHHFGWLQNSVWLSPDPIDDFQAKLSEKNISPDSLTYLEARPAGRESHEAMVLAAWDFAALEKSYRGYREILRLSPGRSRDIASWRSWIEAEHRAWQQIVRRDPFLPAQLLPKGYVGPEAWAARREAFAECATALAKLHKATG